jgi:hypothetical protein
VFHFARLVQFRGAVLIFCSTFDRHDQASPYDHRTVLCLETHVSPRDLMEASAVSVSPRKRFRRAHSRRTSAFGSWV